MAFQFDFHAFVFVGLGCVVPAGCATKLADENGADTETGDGDTGDGDGDGDGDAGDGDGDGDPDTGDGDGDPDTGDGDGDGDGDPETGDGDGDGDALPDATYLLAIETTLGPDLPLQFVLDVFNLVQTNDGATADFVLQPLSLQQGWTTPGECIGVPLEYEGVAFDVDGNFVLDMGLVMVSGQANPVTGSDMEATMVLHGHTVEPNAMCGDMTGMLMSPIEYDLAGSTFAAIPLAGGCDADPFPAPINNCGML